MKIAPEDIPEHMKHLPLDERGYPIPYFVPIVDGKPNFKYQDPKKKPICRKYKKCHICGGHLLAKSFWFISGPIGLRNRVSSDEPMHEECARFSLNFCPHLLNYKAERKAIDESLPTQLMNKPTQVFLVKADEVWYADGIHTMYNPIYTEHYHYKDNILTKESNGKSKG